MSPRQPFLSALLNRPGILLFLLGCAGAALSAYTGYQEKLQHQALERLRLSETVDLNFASVQDHLALRENLATSVGALFIPPPLSTPHPLAHFGDQIATLVPDLQTIGWLPEVTKEHFAEAIEALEKSGMKNPRFFDNHDQAITPETMTGPIYPVLDIAPSQNRRVLGVDAASFPDRLAAIAQARDTHRVTRTGVLQLVQSPERDSILLYAPVFAKDKTFLGVLGFGYPVKRLFASPANVAKGNQPLEIRVFAENFTTPLAILEATGEEKSSGGSTRAHRTDITRNTTFAQQQLTFVYSIPRDLSAEGTARGAAFVGVGLLLTGAAIGILGFMANRTNALAREVDSRRSAEARMKVLIHELNHRVRNVLSVVQAVVRLSFTSGYSLVEVQKTCEGRLQALANAMTLLTASDWKSVGIRELISSDTLPFVERITVTGENIPLKARAAQTFALLLYELATNAAKHGAFSNAQGKVALNWTIDRGPAESVFHLSWKETGGPAVNAPSRRGFGELLLRRIAPRDVAGQGILNYDADGLEYRLDAPLREIVYDGVRREQSFGS